MLRIPHWLDNRLIDGAKVVSPTVTILGISHRPVFYLKGLFVPQRKHIMSCLYVYSCLTGNTLRAVHRFVRTSQETLRDAYRFVRTSQETHYELSIGLFVPHSKHIMSCL
jgi:hypothetical protein